METVGEYEYDRKSLIGHGAFALVYKGRHKKTKLPVAIKCINKKNLGRSSSLLGKEIKILKELHHENIVQLYECESSAQSYFLVMEYCNGGDLADYLQSKGTLSEDTIRLFFRLIANAMKAMHDQGILHRDLKPQNLLLSYKVLNPKPQDIVIKIADFGFARHLQTNMMAATLCGSPMYMAPEVITSKQYNAKADLWSIGTIIYQCLVGNSPFQANTPQELRNFYEQTRRVEPKIPHGTSKSLTDLLLKLLKKNVAERINFTEFFKHEFFSVRNKISPPMPVPTRPSDPSFSPNSSNTSDPRSVVADSPHVGTDCSPSEGDPLFLRNSSSSSDSEDFVMVSHPFSSSESLNAMHGTKKDMEAKATPRATKNSPIHRQTNQKSRLNSDSPKHTAEDTEVARAQLRETEVRSPFMQRTVEGAGSPVTVRFSALYSNTRRRVGSGSDSDASTQSRPSPVPIPVPTQIENFGKFERSTSARSSGSSFEDKGRIPKPRTRSMSPLCIDGSPSNQSSSQSGTALQKALKMFGTPPPPGYPTILENPDGSGRLNPNVKAIKFSDAFKAALDNKEETLVARMARAWTAPDLAKLNQQRYLAIKYDMTRSKSSAGLYKRDMEVLAEGKVLESPRSLNNINLIGRDVLESKTKVPQNRKVEKPRFTDSIFETATAIGTGESPEVQEFQFYCQLSDNICEVAEQHTLMSNDFFPDLTTSSSTIVGDDPLQHLTQKQKQCEQLLLYLRSLQIVATALHTLRNKVNAGNLEVSDAIKKVAKELNDRYKKSCKLCEDAKQQCNLTETSRISFVSADKILYFQAVNDCRTAALDEMFEGSLSQCVKRYKRALLLLEGLSLATNDNLDKNRLSKYKRGIRYRLQHLEH